MDKNNTEIRGETSQWQNVPGNSRRLHQNFRVCYHASLCTGHFRAKNKMLSKHNASVMYTQTREQSQTSSSMSFFIVVDRPIQHFTSGILSLCLFDSQTTVHPQQLNSKIFEKTTPQTTRKEKA